MITLWLLLGGLTSLVVYLIGWTRGYDHASKFAADVVERQCAEIARYRATR